MSKLTFKGKPVELNKLTAEESKEKVRQISAQTNEKYAEALANLAIHDSKMLDKLANPEKHICFCRKGETGGYYVCKDCWKFLERGIELQNQRLKELEDK